MSDVKQNTPKWWVAQIEDRLKALRKNWLNEADLLIAKYEAEQSENTNDPFNILYSNTETLLPALFNSTPRPDVERRYTTSATERKLDSAVAQCAERLLEYSEDSDATDYASFCTEVRTAVLHALVPGQGQIRIRMLQEGGKQEVAYDSLAYDRFIWSYARKWCHVTWVGFGYDLNREGFESQFSEFAKSEEYKSWNKDGAGWKGLKERFDSDPTKKQRDEKTGQPREPTLLVWEIWNHEKKEIKYSCDVFPEVFIEEEKYPFSLTNRFPCPEPLKFVLRNNNLDPKPLYKMYEKQDRELQEISRRYLRVLKAVRARGAYNARFKEFEQIFGQDSDNALVPIENADALLDTAGGLEKAIWFAPIDTIVAVVEKLAIQREGIKQTIYEITGIGDLLRSQAIGSDTAKEAEIVNSWGTLRLKRMQNQVSYFCRDLFRISFEFMAAHYSMATIIDITKLEYLTKQEKQTYQKAMAQFQQAQQQAQQMQQQAQQTGQQPPPPPQPPPIPQEKLALLDFPIWEDIIGIMKDAFQRSYRIDIETNSTVDLEATEDKQSMNDFMMAFGQMAAGLKQMGEAEVLPYEVSKAIIGETLRRFRFGRRIEQLLEMSSPPSGAGQAAAAQQAAMDQLKQQTAAQVAAAQAQTQQVREQVRKGEADFAREKIELVNALKMKEIELTTARGTAQLDTKIAEHKTALADVSHATQLQGQQTQLGGVQRNLEMERLNHQGTKNSQQQELLGRDKQMFDLDKRTAENEFSRRIDQHTDTVKRDKMASEHMSDKQKLESTNRAYELKNHEQSATHAKERLSDAAKSEQAGDSKHKELSGTLQKILEVSMAPRQTELQTGPDGKKIGISRPIKGE